MDYFPSKASLSHQPSPENLTILEGINNNQDVYKVNGGRLGHGMLADTWESLKVW